MTSSCRWRIARSATPIGKSVHGRRYFRRRQVRRYSFAHLKCFAVFGNRLSLGTGTAALYFTTAYFAIRAPKVAGTQTHGPIRLHKALAWIHGTGLVLTPILGAMAFQQKSNGEKVDAVFFAAFADLVNGSPARIDAFGKSKQTALAGVSYGVEALTIWKRPHDRRHLR